MTVLLFADLAVQAAQVAADEAYGKARALTAKLSKSQEKIVRRC